MAKIEAYQTKAGKRWRVRYRTPDRRQTDKRGFTTKRDAEAWASTVEVTKMRGEYVAPKLGRVTVGELGPAWLDRQRGHMKPSGFRSYESAWRVHVAPRWRDVRVSEIVYSDVQAWVSELAAKRGAVIVQTAHSVLARILDDAIRDRLIVANAARGIKLPPNAQRRNVYLSADQLGRLADESGRYRSLVLLLGTAGLRWGEAAGAAGVRYRLFAPPNRAAPQRGNGRTADVCRHAEVRQGRTVVLAAFVVDELAATCEGKERDELIWPSATGGYLAPPSSTESWLSGAVARCRKADPTFPRVTAHALRHTAASLAISAGLTRRSSSECSGTNRGDDARRLRRTFRLRSEPSCRKVRRNCGQNMGKTALAAHIAKRKTAIYQRERADSSGASCQD